MAYYREWMKKGRGFAVALFCREVDTPPNVGYEDSKRSLQGIWAGGLFKCMAESMRRTGESLCEKFRPGRMARIDGGFMEKDASQVMEQWKRELEAAWRDMPKKFRTEKTARRTLQCCLYARAASMGYKVVADYMPPRVADRPVDVVVLDDRDSILFAVCLDSMVTLAAVKSLDSFEARHKVIYTMSPMEKKVRESRFFLKPDIVHHHLQRNGGDGW